MPNLSAGKKSVRSDRRKTVYNLRRRRTMKDIVKEIETLVENGDIKSATAKLPDAYKAIDKAAKRKVIKPNTAARKKSRLARLIATDK